MKCTKHSSDLGNVGEVLEGFLHVHIEHIADALAFESNVQSLAAEPLALADWAGDPDVGEKVHLEAVGSIAVACFASAARNVETKAARSITACFGLGELGVEIADQVEQFDVGRGVRAGSAANRRLVDVNNLVKVFDTLDPGVFAQAP